MKIARYVLWLSSMPYTVAAGFLSRFMDSKILTSITAEGFFIHLPLNVLGILPGRDFKNPLGRWLGATVVKAHLRHML